MELPGAVSVAVGGRDAMATRRCWKISELLDGRPRWAFSSGSVSRRWSLPGHGAELALHASHFAAPEMSGWVLGLTVSPGDAAGLLRARWFHALRERLGNGYRLDTSHGVRITGVFRRPPFLDPLERLCTAVQGPRALGIRKRQWSDARPLAALAAMDAGRWRVLSLEHAREEPLHVDRPQPTTTISLSTTETGTNALFNMPPRARLSVKLRDALADVRHRLHAAGYEQPDESIAMRHHPSSSIAIARREIVRLEGLQDGLAQLG